MKTLAVLLIATAAFPATPAEMAIEKAQAEIAKHPDHSPYYNALAMAYARRSHSRRTTTKASRQKHGWN